MKKLLLALLVISLLLGGSPEIAYGATKTKASVKKTTVSKSQAKAKKTVKSKNAKPVKKSTQKKTTKPKKKTTKPKAMAKKNEKKSKTPKPKVSKPRSKKETGSPVMPSPVVAAIPTKIKSSNVKPKPKKKAKAVKQGCDFCVDPKTYVNQPEYPHVVIDQDPWVTSDSYQQVQDSTPPLMNPESLVSRDSINADPINAEQVLPGVNPVVIQSSGEIVRIDNEPVVRKVGVELAQAVNQEAIDQTQDQSSDDNNGSVVEQSKSKNSKKSKVLSKPKKLVPGKRKSKKNIAVSEPEEKKTESEREKHLPIKTLAVVGGVAVGAGALLLYKKRWF